MILINWGKTFVEFKCLFVRYACLLKGALIIMMEIAMGSDGEQ